MFKKLFFMIVFITLLSLMVACSSESIQESSGAKDSETKEAKNTDSNNTNQEETDAGWDDLLSTPELPKTIADIATQSSGQLANLNLTNTNTREEDTKKAMKVFEQLPKLKEGASEEKMDAYWRKLMYLFHKDYPEPNNMIEELKYSRFGSPEIEDERFQFKQNLNVEIILDASGSMAGMVNGKSKMEAAKESIESFASSLPEGANVGLRVYGHKGTGSDSDKELSCNSSDLVYELQNYDANQFDKALNKFQPAGWTPIALALKKAKEDLSEYPAKNSTNIIYLVSDGVATCGGDPVKVAQNLADSDINPIVNVLGFNVESEGQQQLQEISEKIEGVFTTIQNQEQLKEQLEKAKNIADKWEQWKTNAGYEASSQYYQQDTDILGFMNDWNGNNVDESYNISRALSRLEEAGYISEDAHDYISAKSDERNNQIDKYTNTLQEDLNNINEKNFEEAKKQITEKYDENTNN